MEHHRAVVPRSHGSTRPLKGAQRSATHEYGQADWPCKALGGRTTKQMRKVIKEEAEKRLPNKTREEDVSEQIRPSGGRPNHQPGYRGGESTPSRRGNEAEHRSECREARFTGAQ